MRSRTMLVLAMVPLGWAHARPSLAQFLQEMSQDQAQVHITLDPVGFGLSDPVPNVKVMDTLVRMLGDKCGSSLWEQTGHLLSLARQPPSAEEAKVLPSLLTYLSGFAPSLDAAALAALIGGGPVDTTDLARHLETHSPARQPDAWPLHTLQDYINLPGADLPGAHKHYASYILKKRPFDRAESGRALLKLLDNPLPGEEILHLVPTSIRCQEDVTTVERLLGLPEVIKSPLFTHFAALESPEPRLAVDTGNRDRRCSDLTDGDPASAHYVCYQVDKKKNPERAEILLAQACKHDPKYCPGLENHGDLDFVLESMSRLIDKTLLVPDERYNRLKKTLSRASMRNVLTSLLGLAPSPAESSVIPLFIEDDTAVDLALMAACILSQFEKLVKQKSALKYEFTEVARLLTTTLGQPAFYYFVREYWQMMQKILQRFTAHWTTDISTIMGDSLEAIFASPIAQANFLAKPPDKRVLSMSQILQQRVQGPLRRFLQYELLRQPENRTIRSRALRNLVDSASDQTEFVPLSWFSPRVERGRINRAFPDVWSSEATSLVKRIRRLGHNHQYWAEFAGLTIADDFGEAQRDLEQRIPEGQSWQDYAKEPTADPHLLAHVNYRDCAKCGRYCRCKDYGKLGDIACYVAGYLGYLWGSEGVSGAVDFAVYCDGFLKTHPIPDSERLRMATWRAVYGSVRNERDLADAIASIPEGMKEALCALPYSSPLWERYPALLATRGALASYIRVFITKQCTSEHPYLLNAYTRFPFSTDSKAREKESTSELKKMMEEFSEILANPTTAEEAYERLRRRLYDIFFQPDDGYAEERQNYLMERSWDSAIKGISAHILRRVREQVGEEAYPGPEFAPRVIRAMKLLIPAATRDDWDLFMQLSKSSPTEANIPGRREVLELIETEKAWAVIREKAGVDNLERLLLDASKGIDKLTLLCELLKDEFKADVDSLGAYNINHAPKPRNVLRLLAALHNDSIPGCALPRYWAFKKALADSDPNKLRQSVSTALAESWAEHLEEWSNPTKRTFHAAGLELLIDQYFGEADPDRSLFRPVIGTTLRAALDYDQGRTIFDDTFGKALAKYVLDLMHPGYDRRGGLFSEESRQLINLALLYDQTVGNLLMERAIDQLGPMVDVLARFFAKSPQHLEQGAFELPLVDVPEEGPDPEVSPDAVISTIKRAFLTPINQERLAERKQTWQLPKISGVERGEAVELSDKPLDLRTAMAPPPSATPGGPPPPPPPPPPGGAPPPPPTGAPPPPTGAPPPPTGAPPPPAKGPPPPK